MHRPHLSLAAAAALLAPICAQEAGEESGLRQNKNVISQLQDWQAAHGHSWNVHMDASTGFVEMLYGGGALPPFAPDTETESDWFTLARHWVTGAGEMLGVSEAELVDERFVYLPMGMANGTDKITVRLRQVVNGLPVENGVINALFDTKGRLLSLHSTASPFTDDLPLAPAFGGRSAIRTAIDAFESGEGVVAVDVGVPVMLYAQVDRGAGRQAFLAYQVTVKNLEVPAAKKYTISAADGSVLRVDEEIHYFDVTGTIKANATPGTEADHSGNPPTDLVMPYINVQSSAGTVQTDRDGNFVIAGVNTPVDITVTYNGTFNNVNNQAGSDYSITFPNVQPNQANTLLMNPNPGELRTAQANAYLHINVVRDYIRDTIPSDNTADFKATSNANINSSCNAYFDGGSVNYYTSGGGCNNTAFSSVVAHELGHWLNVRYGTGNGSDGMGEGNADVFSMYTYDDPVVGRFFTTGGGFVRTGTNTRQFCGDNNSGCHGGVHANGEVWMGAAWKVRRNLKSSLGVGLGGATADQLFMGWMNSYNQTQIKSIIEIQWLTLDDDDANIDNGTPNYPDIDGGFREQGFPGYDLPFIQFSNVTELPDVASDVGPYTVDADIVAAITPPIATANIVWRVDGGSWSNVAMGSTGGSGFTGQIPAIGGNGFVEYYLDATDSGGNSGTFPADGENDPLDFTVGVPTILAAWDFEAGNNEGWVAGSIDTATTGFWERGDPRGTAAQPENDHTSGTGNVNCWFTGQGSVGGSVGENDIDGGRVSLDSPVIDMSGLTGVQIRYWRWFSNDEGASPGEDTMRIRVSFDGGASFTSGELIGPGGVNEASGGWFEGGFSIDSIGTPTSQMVFRVVASDEGDGSIVEAAFDDVEISYLDGGCPTPTNYCVGAPNSAGPGATMSWNGSQNVNDNSFTLFAAGCPSKQFGYFFYGSGQQQTAVGNGFLCVAGSQLFRLPVVKTDDFGLGVINVDFTNLPNNGDIFNGTTWNFQFGYRDNAGGGAGFNFTDGLSVTFCD